MDNRQIHALVKNDSFLNQKECHAIAQSAFPDIMPLNSIYFVLIKPKEKLVKRGKLKYQVGHWILISCLSKTSRGKRGKKPEIFYIDPYGLKYPPEIGKKLRKSAALYKVRVQTSRHKIQKFSSVCGPLCCYLALLRARNFSYDQIFKKKIVKSTRVMAEIVPNIISSLLPKGRKKLLRFSLDFL